MDLDVKPAAPGQSPPPPPIEHITQNYVSLRSLILSVSERCGKELANVLRTTENLPSDADRKNQLLWFVVMCRQEYVKLYVLCKWAVVSGEISKAIDVANWLRGQVNCFNNVVDALYHLQAGLGPAKSPWADIETALQVLKYGGPLPPPEAKLHLPVPPLDDKQVLGVLRRLDILIALRLALHEQLPGHYGDYEVKNGRARFYLGNHTLWVELSIADEEVATQCRFFFVDCGLSTDEELTPGFRLRIETAVNEQLATRSLVDVLDWLSMFVAVYKLQLLDKQLAAVETGAGPWAGVVSHRYSPSSLIIRYFLDATDPGEARVTVSPKAPHGLVVDIPLDVDLDGPIDNLAVSILSTATKAHAVRLISAIRAPCITPISDLALSLELAPSKFTELTIDTTSGRYFLSGTGPLVLEAQQQLNKGTDPLETLTKLRTQVYMDTIASRAEAVGWRALRNVRLAPDEFSKIAPYTSLLALRLSNTTGWSLCVALKDSSDSSVSSSASSRWFASRIECSQRRWILGPIHDVHSNAFNLDDPDYNTFLELITVYSKQFVLYELMRELTISNIRHGIKQQNTHTLGVVADITTILKGSSSWAYSGLMCTVKDGSIKMEGRAQPQKLVALGTISENFEGAVIDVDGNEGKFSLSVTQGPESLVTSETADKPRDNNSISSSDNNGVNLQRLISALRLLHNAAKSLASAASLNLEVRGATLTSLDIKYAEPRGILSVQNGHNITFGTSNPQRPLTPFLPAVGEHSNSSFGRIVTFLRDWYPVWEMISELSTSQPNLNLVALPQTMNWVRVQSGFDPQAPFLEITLRDFRRRSVVNHVAPGNGAETLPVISRWFRETVSPGVVPLMTGCAVSIGSESAIKEMLIALGPELAS